MGPTTRAVGGAALLALVAGGLFLHGLGRYALLDPDEARHAEVAREMAAARGVRRLFLPPLDLEPYREKPAGYYWLVALAYGALGVGEVAARAVSALAARVAVLALYAYALPRGGPLAALGAGVVAATSVGWFGLARYGNLDMTLTACVTVGVLAGLAWLERPAPRRGPLAPYVAAGLGLVVKGPLALVLVAGPLALAALVQRPRPRVRELGLVRGTLVVVALGALLWVPVGLLDASYLSAFAATNVRRLGAESPHAGPIHYYLLWVPALLFPWTLFAPGPPGREHLVPAAVLGAVLTLYPLAGRWVAPAVAALHSDREAARLIAGAGAGAGPVVAFGIHDPSLTFYLRAPVVHTDDPGLVRDLFAGDGPAFLVTGPRHFAQVEQLLGARARVWFETPRRRLYANRPVNGST